MKVLHCFRSPVGGLFRHVLDLVRSQEAQGIQTGIICDSETGSEQAARVLAELESSCELGIHRIPITRLPGLADFRALKQVKQICAQLQPDIVHGHGAKGGAYSRLVAAKSSAYSVYTPHGGALHYNALSLAGAAFFKLERGLRNHTAAIVFESQFSAAAYEKKVGPIICEYRIIHNGLDASELEANEHEPGEFDFLFLGEFRGLKGLDVFLTAIGNLRLERPVSVIIAGAGRDSRKIEERIKLLDLGESIKLSPPIFPAIAAFRLAKCLVVPSRAESLPYTVLEAAAAGIPLITTKVGGIPEIFGPYAERLIPPDDADALTSAMRQVTENPAHTQEVAAELRERIRSSFRLDKMTNDISSLYHDVIATAD